VKENAVGFRGLIREVKIKSLVSGDKSVRITVEFDNPTQDLIEKLNQVQIPDKHVGIYFAELKE